MEERKTYYFGTVGDSVIMGPLVCWGKTIGSLIPCVKNEKEFGSWR